MITIVFRRVILCDKIEDAELVMNKFIYMLSKRTDVPEEKDIYKTDRKRKEIIFNGGTKYVFTTKEKYNNGNVPRIWNDHTIDDDNFRDTMQTYVDYPNIYYGPPD